MYNFLLFVFYLVFLLHQTKQYCRNKKDEFLIGLIFFIIADVLSITIFIKNL